MIDLHTHTLLSDGELVPSELARRARVKGYGTVGFSDHADITNIESVVSSILKIASKASQYEGITVVPGVEITHVPPPLIGEMIRMAREMGIWYVVVHGETIAEPVEQGTNRAGILGGADILAHPGLITEEEMALARDRKVLVEISGRKGHSLANGHVAALGRRLGARFIFDTDAHGPSDLVTDGEAERIVKGAGLSAKDFAIMQENARQLVEGIFKARQ
jgi:putative hydrolase